MTPKKYIKILRRLTGGCRLIKTEAGRWLLTCIKNDAAGCYIRKDVIARMLKAGLISRVGLTVTALGQQALVGAV